MRRNFAYRSGAPSRWLPVLVVAGSLVVASVVPIPDQSGGHVGLLGIDKWLHALGYAGLAAALVAALADGERSTVDVIVLVLALSLSYGLAVELLQAVVPTRQFELADLPANAVGSGAAIVGWRVAARRSSASATASSTRR